MNSRSYEANIYGVLTISHYLRVPCPTRKWAQKEKVILKGASTLYLFGVSHAILEAHYLQVVIWATIEYFRGSQRQFLKNKGQRKKTYA
jgi:hypothetical protein